MSQTCCNLPWISTANAFHLQEAFIPLIAIFFYWVLYIYPSTKEIRDIQCNTFEQMKNWGSLICGIKSEGKKGARAELRPLCLWSASGAYKSAQLHILMISWCFGFSFRSPLYFFPGVDPFPRGILEIGARIQRAVRPNWRHLPSGGSAARAVYPSSKQTVSASLATIKIGS